MSETKNHADLLRRRQLRLMSAYRDDPGPARVVDVASTHAEQTPAQGPLDPLYTSVCLGEREGPGRRVPVAVHRAVGGLSDHPVPGDILCGALASCADSTLRVVANALGVGLQSLAVEVEGDVDVRGALHVSAEVPVAFQRFRVSVRLRATPGTDADRLERVLQTAEHSCVVMQTLRAATPVEVSYDVAVLDASERVAASS